MAGTAVLAAVVGGVVAGATIGDNRPVAAAQSAPQAQVQQALRDKPGAPARASRVTFVVTQTTEFAARSKDQITIVFTDRSWEGISVPPTPLFGEDILEEFSFSAADFDKRTSLTFTRVVRDAAFLAARYIRVMNHGDEGWGGGTLSMSVDGKPVLDRVDMRPRKGDPTEGLKDCNRLEWRNRTYWETELDRVRRKPSLP
jgi:hypothetical protein